MKYLLIFFIGSLLFSCSGRNDLTTQLLNEKKILSDSMARAQVKRQDYFEKSFNEKSAGADPSSWSAYEDSSTIYLRYVIQIQQRIKAIDFSLDSLSRMK